MTGSERGERDSVNGGARDSHVPSRLRGAYDGLNRSLVINRVNCYPEHGIATKVDNSVSLVGGRRVGDTPAINIES